ncbi:hypothetical protein [Halioxenophilus sp. WMMB6]|uniref:hypothetical protein n=1 Tax=Halioxenophilus sp. WMMB6 TaxID=3073815 RepID=UPI00295ECB33|nr:hypothetical protein [Halioxenophilus sp. WMMB6]
MVTECPKCHYQRQASDRHLHPEICPGCGIAYNKWQARAPAVDQPQPGDSNVTPEEAGHSWRSAFFTTPDKVDPARFTGRIFLLVIFTIWSGFFIMHGISWTDIGGSFMHNINLPFHEFGHLLFAFFGRFMAILGGSLFQVLLPLGLMFAFVVQRRDPFAGAIMLWWCGQNFIDISPYINDAPYRAIPLIGGMSESAHDWGNLLTLTNRLESAHSLARFSFTLGSLVMILAIGWGSYLLYRQSQRLAH